MALDVLIAVIVILAMANGFREGFARSFLHVVSWVLSAVFAFAFAPKIKDALLANTGIYDSMRLSMTESFAGAVTIENAMPAFPDMLKDTLSGLSRQAAEAAGTAAADFIFTLIAFLVGVLIAKLALFLLVTLLSKKSRKGVGGFIDGALGLSMGLVKGVFLVSLLLAVMIPALSLLDSGLAQSARAVLDSSRFAGTLYDNNIVVLIVRDFLL